MFNNLFGEFDLFAEHIGGDFLKNRVPVKQKIDEKSAKIFFELPGVEKENIKVSLVEGLLTVDVKKKVHDENFVYHRKYEVNDEFDSKEISVEFKNGLLSIEIPRLKPQKTQNNQIFDIK